MSRQVTPPQSRSTPLASGSTDTPLSKKQSGFESHSSTSLKRNERFQDMSSEISKYVVGPMPVSKFLDKFLRPEISSASADQVSNELEDSIASDPTERFKAYLTAGRDQKYGTLVAALQPICSNFKFIDTNATPMTTFQGLTIRPDICVFKRESDVDITKVEIMMELKSANFDDPFADISEESFVKRTATGGITLGQSTLYAATHQAAQFRTHIFSLLVFPTHARLLRWDRSGVIVTQSLPIISKHFVEFFQLYDRATPSMRGFDPSVSTPSAENASKARTSLGIHIHSNLPVVQLSVNSSPDEAYIVPRHTFMNNTHSPLGRSTRTFIAYSISRKRNVFLKDSWRLDHQTPEHEIYAELHDKDVPHLPTVIAGSDILNQTTLTQDVLGEDSTPRWIKVRPKPLRKHKHYRLVLKEIATPLRSFRSTKILVTAICDAIEAHRAAYFDAGILHRDISSGNIMIYNDRGLLIDWDLSKSTQVNGARESERTGTWQFISCRLLKDPTAVQTLTDDIESFIHVLTWVSFRFAKHNMTNAALDGFLRSTFDYAYYETDGLAKGGNAKMRYLNLPSELIEAEFENPILKALLTKITKAISFRYLPSPSLEDADGDVATLNRLLNAHKKRLGTLKDSEWIINEFASALKLPTWPDEAGKYENTEIAQLTTHAEDPPSSSKRKSSEDAGGKGKKPRALASR